MELRAEPFAVGAERAAHPVPFQESGGVQGPVTLVQLGLSSAE